MFCQDINKKKYLTKTSSVSKYSFLPEKYSFLKIFIIFTGLKKCKIFLNFNKNRNIKKYTVHPVLILLFWVLICMRLGFFVLLAMAVYTGVTVNYYGKRYGSWRFSWSYIMGWVAVVLTFFSGSSSSSSSSTTSSSWHAFAVLRSPCCSSQVSSTCAPTACTNAHGIQTRADIAEMPVPTANFISSSSLMNIHKQGQ